MTDGDEWVPGESSHDESELARVGRVAVAQWYMAHADDVYMHANRVLNRAFAGEDVTQEDAMELRRCVSGLRHVLEEYIQPVVDETEQREPAVNLSEATGHTPDNAGDGEGR